MSTDTDDYREKEAPSAPQPQATHIHNHIQLGGNRWMNILITLLVCAGIMVIGWQLSLGPLKDTVATGMSMFAVALITNCFKAGLLKLPAKQGDDDLAFTKSTLRRIYDEIQKAIINSGIVRLVLFAAAYALGFVLLKTSVAWGLGLISSSWMAIGVGLIGGAALVGQEYIWAWFRRSWAKNGAK